METIILSDGSTHRGHVENQGFDSMGEFNEAQLESKMKEFKLPEEVVEHIRTIVIYNENLL